MKATQDRIDIVKIENGQPMLCRIPFNQILVDPKGDAYLCCASHIKNISAVAGNLIEKDGLEIWNNEIYKAFRMSFVDGSFRYCKSESCSAAANRHEPEKRLMVHTVEEINADPELAASNFAEFCQSPDTFDGSLMRPPTRLYLGMDLSCNLKCPSCRNKLISEDSQNGRLDKLYANLRSLTPGIEDLELDGAGDVFASSWYQKFLKHFPKDDFPNLKQITVRSNGLLWNEKNWYRIHPYFRSKLIYACITVDATTPETYKKVRGGCFHTLMENLEFVKSLHNRGEVGAITLVMVYRKSNYQEIPDFIEMGRAMNADYLVIHPLQPWAESSYVLNGQYNDEAIHLGSHKENSTFKSFIEQRGVKAGNIGRMFVDFA